MISKSVFLQEIKKLELNFGVVMSEERFVFFHERLSSWGFDDAKFTEVIETILCKERFFPTLAVFFAYKPKVEFVL